MRKRCELLREIYCYCFVELMDLGMQYPYSVICSSTLLSIFFKLIYDRVGFMEEKYCLCHVKFGCSKQCKKKIV